MTASSVKTCLYQQWQFISIQRRQTSYIPLECSRTPQSFILLCYLHHFPRLMRTLRVKTSEPLFCMILLNIYIKENIKIKTSPFKRQIKFRNSCDWLEHKNRSRFDFCRSRRKLLNSLVLTTANVTEAS